MFSFSTFVLHDYTVQLCAVTLMPHSDRLYLKRSFEPDPWLFNTDLSLLREDFCFSDSFVALPSLCLLSLERPTEREMSLFIRL